MYEKIVKINSIDNANSFVEATRTLKEDVDVLVGRYIVDGKSILGVLSTNLLVPLRVQVHGDDTEKYDKLFSRFL